MAKKIFEILNSNLKSDEIIVLLKKEFGPNWREELEKEEKKRKTQNSNEKNLVISILRKKESNVTKFRPRKNLVKTEKKIPEKEKIKRIEKIIFFEGERKVALIERVRYPQATENFSVESFSSRRNLHCPFEGECLIDAMKANFRAFSCEKCPMFGKR